MLLLKETLSKGDSFQITGHYRFVVEKKVEPMIYWNTKEMQTSTTGTCCDCKKERIHVQMRKTMIAKGENNVATTYMATVVISTITQTRTPDNAYGG